MSKDKMIVRITIEDTQNFDEKVLMDWLNDQLLIGNMGIDSETVATNCEVVQRILEERS